MLSAFDITKKLFVYVSADNRIKVWNVASGNLEKELVEPKHLTVNYTCLSWPLHHTEKKQSKTNETQLLALGTEMGSIVVWNIAKAEIFKTFDEKKDGHTARINDLVLTQTGQLFSCSDDGFICQWDVLSGQLLWKSKKQTEPARKVCVSSDTTILASGSSSIRLWDLSSKKVIKKIVAHSSAVTSMKFTTDDKFLLTGSSERFIYLWDCSASTEDTIAVQAFVSGGAAQQVDIQQHGESFVCLALLDSNSIDIWHCMMSQKQKKPAKADSTVSSQSTIFAVQFSNENQILVAYGNVTKPTFHKLDYVDQTGEFVKEQELTAVPTNVLLPSKQSKKTTPKKKSNETIIGSVNMPLADTEILSFQPPTTTETDISLQEKLETLGLSIPYTKEIPKANSLHSIIMQGLQTNDIALLETCFQTTDAMVIKNTVRGLPSAQVISFLTLIMERFQAAPYRTEFIPWIRSVLVYHSAYLVTVPDLSKSLAGLYASIDSRLTAFPYLLKLSGRLDLLLSQISHVNEVYDYRIGATVYEEEEEDDESAEEEDTGNVHVDDDEENADAMDYEDD